jgi:hypothetical protein
MIRLLKGETMNQVDYVSDHSLVYQCKSPMLQLMTFNAMTFRNLLNDLSCSYGSGNGQASSHLLLSSSVEECCAMNSSL